MGFAKTRAGKHQLDHADEAKEGRKSYTWLPDTCSGGIAQRMRTVMGLSQTFTLPLASSSCSLKQTKFRLQTQLQ